MELSGPWRALPADEVARRTFHDPDHDDTGWTPVAVPGHWATEPALIGAEAVLHRTRFETPALEPGRRWWLGFEGILQQGDVWLDGAYLGDTEGYFVPHSFDVTELVEAGRDHTLAVDVTCRRFTDPDNRSSLTGALQDPELCGAVDRVPGGIWRPVTLRSSGPTAICHWRVVCVDANPVRARLALRAVLDTPEAGPVVLRTRVAGHEHELHHSAAAGENRVEWTVEVPSPDLWWPHRLGDQPLHTLQLEAVVNDEVNDAHSRLVGFRSVRMRDWILSVNGERLFTRGITTLPTRALLADASQAEIRGDLVACREAGLDLVRPIAHIAHPHLYDAADELGLLIWQDLPLRGLMSRGVRDQARRQAREAVDLLGHHPSIVVWCAHDEPFARPERPSPTPPIVGQQRPSWNRTVLDRSLKRVFERTDGSRPVVAHTAVPPHLPTLDGTTSHLWFGWRGGRAADLAAALARVPRMGRFISAFGAASVDPDAIDDRWPGIDWEHLGRACAADPVALRHLVAPEVAADGPAWASLTRAAQAEVVKTSIELLRRVRFRPTGGFILHTLADPGISGGFGVLDHDRRPKPAWQAMIDACRPVIVVADPLPPHVHPGERLEVAVHLVSDRAAEVAETVLRAHVWGPAGDIAERRWSGPLVADSVELVGRVAVTVPDGPGHVTLDLELQGPGVEVTNRYRVAIH
ncbi:MAG: glycoside hydrolase family 2 protein [Acidimicrobiales bacterium]